MANKSGGNKVPFLEGKGPEINKKINEEKKGVRLFFGDKEESFFENAGREISESIIQESFILYRIDLQKTRSHKLYGEAKKKVYLEPVEVFALINIEALPPEHLAPGGLLRKGFGKITAQVYLSHLEELDVEARLGDFIHHKGNYYEITDDGSSNIDNKHTYTSDRYFYITITGVEVNKDKFDAR